MNKELAAFAEEYRSFADAGVMSGYEQFLRVLPETPGFQRLQEEAKTRADHLAVYRRAVEILEAPFDTRYAHPAEMPITAYLFLLQSVAPDIALSLAEKVEPFAAHFFWGGWLAAQVREEAARRAAS